MKKWIGSLCLAGMTWMGAYGQESPAPLKTGTANYLTIPADARSAAMGGCGVAMTDGNGAIFHNGAAALQDASSKGGISYTYIPWMRDHASGFSLHSVGGFYRINRRHAVLLGFRRFGYPSLSGMGEGTADIHPKELAIEAEYAYRIVENLSVSATVKYLYADMGTAGDGNGAGTVAFDVAALYSREFRNLTDAFWSVGLQATHIGPKMKFLTSHESLPTMLKAGGAVSLPFLQIHRFTLTADALWRLSPSDVRTFGINAGAEYSVASLLMLRGGYHYGDKEKGDNSYATAGAGIKYKGIRLDFAWMFAGRDCPARNTYWLSLGYGF